MSNSGLVNYTRISPNSNNPRNAPIKKITIHHMAGNLSVETCGNVFASSSRQASSNYGIDSNGRVGMYVEEKNRSWCSSNPNNDHQAITIEVANDGGAPDWHVSDTALAKLIDLCVDICKRNSIDRLNYTGDTNGNLTRHNMFANTSCPGPYLQSQFPYIANEVNRRLNNNLTSADQILVVGSKVKFNGVFKVDEIILPNKKYPNGAVGSYATCYGAPVGIDDYIPCGPLATCDANGNNANYNGILKVGGYWKSDNIFTVIGVELPTNRLKNGVAILEADGVRFRCDCGPLYEISDN